jgi:hypothetical protein
VPVKPPLVIDPTPPNAPYVLPFSTNGELNDTGINRFLQSLVVGVTGLPPHMVRPRWQKQPPDQPGIDEDWSAVGPIRREREKFPAIKHSTDPDNFYRAKDTIYNNEIVEVLASFYGPNKDRFAELFTLGVYLEQNRTAIFLNGFALVDVDDILNVPAIIKERWVPGDDVPFRLRRQQIYSYPVPNLKYAQATVFVEKAPAEQGYGQGPFNEFPFQGESGDGIIVDASVVNGYPSAPYSIAPFGEE